MEQIDKETGEVLTEDGQSIALPRGQHILPVLHQLQDGNLLDRMGLMLTEVVRAVTDEENEARKGGKIVVEISVDMVKQKSVNAVFLAAKLKATTPEKTPRSTILFYDDEGGLHLRDPNQKEMFPRPNSV